MGLAVRRAKSFSEMPEEIVIPASSVQLPGILNVPSEAAGIVIFAHGSGSGRLSPRNTFVAKVLEDKGLATLLFDLLTEDEDVTYATRFDIPLLTRRLKAATRWVLENPKTQNLPIGYFGASTGSAAALAAAAKLRKTIAAVVSRGGRPDLVLPVLQHVIAATLFLVGGNDEQVLGLNKQAYALLHAEKKLRIIPGATHLFEERGALEEVARLAADWFGEHLR